MRLHLPWNYHPAPSTRPAATKPPADTGGRRAREQAEASLADTRQRRELVTGLRAVLERDLERNHYGEHIANLLGGDRSRER